MVYKNDVPNQCSKTMKFGEDLKKTTTDALKWTRDPISVMEHKAVRFYYVITILLIFSDFFTLVKLLQWPVIR